MGITIFKIFIWGGISLDIRSEITFYGPACEVAVKQNFRPYIRRHTSTNKIFEYSYMYPLSGLSVLLLGVISRPVATSYDKKVKIDTF